MSAQSKGTALRLIAPKNSSAKIMSSLGPNVKLESTDLVLSGGRLTTEEMVLNIRDLNRLRDELLHALRQLGIARGPQKNLIEMPDFSRLVSEGQKRLEDNRGQYQEIQSRIESLQRQLEETKKQIAKISELVEGGFTSDDAFSKSGEFTKIIGKLPTRRLEAAQRALQANLQGQAVLAVGNRKKDWVHILAATPSDKAPHALQTLILYDFAQTDVPSSEEPDLDKELSRLDKRRKDLAEELENSRDQMRTFQGEATRILNLLADRVQDSLLFLRAVLKIGEGAGVSHAFAWLEKAPPAKVLSALTIQGVLLELE